MTRFTIERSFPSGPYTAGWFTSREEALAFAQRLEGSAPWTLVELPSLSSLMGRKGSTKS